MIVVAVCQVILATNIAESSVTIPKVAYVIDSCRSLQVYWDKSRKKDCAALVWVSKSQVQIILFPYFLLFIHFP
jgi:HrpA-like RNA helicase